MAEPANNPLPVANEDQPQQDFLSEHLLDWLRTELVWYAGSFSFHLLGLSLLLLLPNCGGPDQRSEVPLFLSNPEETVEKTTDVDVKPLDIGDIESTQPQDLIVDSTPPPPSVEGFAADHASGDRVADTGCGGTREGLKDVPPLGSGALRFGPDPKLPGASGIASGLGTGMHPGAGGNGTGFGKLPRGNRYDFVGSDDRSVPSERAVNAALAWLARHQLYEGNWSLQHYVDRCGDHTCTGKGEILADAGATALGLLPFLAANQTHKSPGPYKEHVRKGIAWLILHQRPDGNLAHGRNK